MLNLKSGQVIQSKDGTWSKVIEVFENSVCMNTGFSEKKVAEECHVGGVLLLNPYITENYILPKEEWEPSDGKGYFFLFSDGDAGSGIWKGADVEVKRKDFLGVFQTEAEALAFRDKIKELRK